MVRRASRTAVLALSLAVVALPTTGCVAHRPVQPDESSGTVAQLPPTPEPTRLPTAETAPSPFLEPWSDTNDDERRPPAAAVRRVRPTVSLPQPRPLPDDEQDLFDQPSPFRPERPVRPAARLPQSDVRQLSTPRPTERAVDDPVPLDEAFPSQERVYAVTEGSVPPDVEPLDGPDGMPPRRPSAAPSRPTAHVVGRGDTLNGIARRYGLTVRQLVAANPGINDANVIAVGMRLVLPSPDEPIRPSVRPTPRPATRPAPRPTPPATTAPARPSPSPTPVVRPAGKPGVRIHHLQAGETLWSVARKYQTTVTNLMILNRLSEASNLAAGRELYVPAVGPAPVPPVPTGPADGGSATYTVQKGDSLWSISRSVGVTVNDLISWNDLGDLTAIPAGTVLKIRPPVRPSPPPITPPARPTARPTARPVARPTARPPSGQTVFDWPLKGKVDKTFGWYEGRPHTGIDIVGPLGASVKAAAAGTVIFADTMRGYGKVIIIDHGNEYFTVYGNLLETLVAKGTAERPVAVSRGAVVGRVGATVEGPTPHLHFEIRKKNKAINPLKFLNY